MSPYSNTLTEYSPQNEFASEMDLEGESGSGVFSESEEMELAAELLELNNEAELEQFLGDFIKKAANAVGSVVRSPIGQAIGGVLKSVAKKALPIAGGALGGFVGGPLGATIGSGLANMAGNALGLELEGLSNEDREFEATRQFVRFAGDTVKNALQAGPNADPLTTAQKAAVDAAKVHAPGLLSSAGTSKGEGKHSGKWVRSGRKIILLGA